MAGAIPRRLSWALELLDVAPRDRVLEIGCGRGAAAALACERLGGGKLVALDRSPAMIRQAERDNRIHIGAGRATFRATDFLSADFGGERFDKVFAVNVGEFHKPRSRGPAVARGLLAPRGSLVLVYQPPDAGRSRGLAALTAENLGAAGFIVRRLDFEEIDSALAFGIVADTP